MGEANFYYFTCLKNRDSKKEIRHLTEYKRL